MQACYEVVLKEKKDSGCHRSCRHGMRVETLVLPSLKILTFDQETDIPDIEQVIQFGVPPSLSVWIQHGGHASCHADLDAWVLLFIGKSMFESQKKKQC
jgi:hypothetical protein